VTPGSSVRVAGSANDLKPLICSVLRNTVLLRFGVSAPGDHTCVCSQKYV
jgi:hypothetical protein